MEKDELKSFIKNLLINNIVYDGYTYFYDAIPEIDYDKTVDGIVNDRELPMTKVTGFLLQ